MDRWICRLWETEGTDGVEESNGGELRTLQIQNGLMAVKFSKVSCGEERAARANSEKGDTLHSIHTNVQNVERHRRRSIIIISNSCAAKKQRINKLQVLYIDTVILKSEENRL